MSDIVTEVWKKYLLQLQIHPLRTKAITSGVLAGCSDFAAQKISGIKKLQFKRLFLIMIYGFFYSGPFGHFLHKVMDKIFKGKKGSTTAGKKVILEQLTASPCNNLFFMMYYGLVVEGRTWLLVKRKIKNDYPPVQLTSWKSCCLLLDFMNPIGKLLFMRTMHHIVFLLYFACSSYPCLKLDFTHQIKRAIFLNLKARSTAIKKA